MFINKKKLFYNILGFVQMKFVRLLNSYLFRKFKENDFCNKNYNYFKVKSNVCKKKKKIYIYC